MNVRTDYLMKLNHRPAQPMVRGAGSWLWDDRGRRYLDAVQGWAVNCLGHSPAVLREALDRQLGQVLNVGPAYFNLPAGELATRLAEASGLDQVFLASSGAEANEAAVKLARRWGQKHRAGAHEIITATDGFHGRTLAMSSATGKPGFAAPFGPAVMGFPKVPYGDADAVAARIDRHTAAVMVEPIQGEAGVVCPPAGYLQQLRALCDREDILLIADEVQTGMARTGPLFAHQHEHVLPDIMTLGKGLGGGLPVSALVAGRRAACFDPGDHGGTFSGNALLCAGACAVFDAITQPEASLHRAASAAHLQRVLGGVAEAHGARLRGRGHLWALVLSQPRASEVQERAFGLGLLVNAPRPHVIRLMPALDIPISDIALLGTLLDQALSPSAHRSA